MSRSVAEGAALATTGLREFHWAALLGSVWPLTISVIVTAAISGSNSPKMLALIVASGQYVRPRMCTMTARVHLVIRTQEVNEHSETEERAVKHRCD